TKESQSLASPPPKDANDEEFSALFDKVMKMDKDLLAKAVVIASLNLDVENLKKDVEFERQELKKMRVERKTLQKPAPEKPGDTKEQRAARYKSAEGAAPDKPKASQEDPKIQELNELIPLAQAYLLRLEGLLREKRNALKQQRAEHATMKRQYEESAQQPINIGKDYAKEIGLTSGPGRSGVGASDRMPFQEQLTLLDYYVTKPDRKKLDRLVDYYGKLPDKSLRESYSAGKKVEDTTHFDLKASESSLRGQLTEAAKAGDLPMVQRLLDMGAGLDQGPGSYSALAYAKIFGSKQLMRLLMSHGGWVDVPWDPWGSPGLRVLLRAFRDQLDRIERLSSSTSLRHPTLKEDIREMRATIECVERGQRVGGGRI
ncbi:MAG: hypothetical protein V2B18_21335, partial [Pseudomonadota bacterium]